MGCTNIVMCVCQTTYDDLLSSGMKKKSPCATIKGSEIFSGTDALVLAVLLARVQDEGFLLTSHSL